ncbi:MAG: PAS-domain containing protein [Pseudomonadota bacterium]
MPDFSPLGVAGAVVLASFAALIILWILGRLGRASVTYDPNSDILPAQSASFLFHDDALSDQEASIDALPGATTGEIRQWSDLRSWLGARFGPLPTSLSELEDNEIRDLPALASDDGATLCLSARRGAQRVDLMDPAQPDPVAQHRARSLDAVLARYVTVLNKAPCAIRIFDPVGQTVWQNKLFAQFSEDEAKTLIDAANTTEEEPRVCLEGERAGQDRHFEVEHTHRGEVSIIYVSDVTQVAQAELVRREFIQTLTKTFANLTTGLAVFDRHRQLALFNPALLDLTGLPTTFLLGQPPLMQFFDGLRDNKVLPEPKSYSTWRTQIEEMISSASDGLYFEDWSLPNGMTYRVTGRPHPDGAIAFLFEDISDEVSLTRRFRSQVDLRQAALDACDQAIAVFGPNNIVLLCNQPCCLLLGIDPDASFAEMSLTDFVAACRRKLPDDAFWASAEAAVTQRITLESVLHDTSGQGHLCRVQSLPGNSAMVSIIQSQVDTQDNNMLIQHAN